MRRVIIVTAGDRVDAGLHASGQRPQMPEHGIPEIGAEARPAACHQRIQPDVAIAEQAVDIEFARSPFGNVLKRAQPPPCPEKRADFVKEQLSEPKNMP